VNGQQSEGGELSMVSSEWVHQRRAFLLTIDHPIAIGSQLTKNKNYDQKLFQDRLAQYDASQSIFRDQHSWPCDRHRCMPAHFAIRIL
jgi:hypothetical protein